MTLTAASSRLTLQVALCVHGRGDGIGAALVQAAVDSAHDEGLARLVLSPSELSTPLYGRLGFRAAHELMVPTGAHRQESESSDYRDRLDVNANDALSALSQEVEDPGLYDSKCHRGPLHRGARRQRAVRHSGHRPNYLELETHSPHAARQGH